MIRISKLLRAAKTISKVPVRGGPGWDRPDVPPSQFVETDRRWTHLEIVYTFFDPSMPEYFITEPQVYEGGLLEALPSLASIWGVLLGTSLAIYLFHDLVNPMRKHRDYDPFQANYFMNSIKRVNEEKIGVKIAKQNPFGLTINSELYPYDSCGKYFYPPKYYAIKQSLENLNTIRVQADNYLKAAMERAAAKNNHQQHSQQAHH